MLKINRVRIEISTEKGLCGFDTEFEQGLNFLASEVNTCGKSSVLAAIYYCLGLEEILGGKCEKVLTSVYKSQIEIGEDTYPVLESGAYLEITNGNEVVTLYRTAKMNGRNSKMITVFYAPYSQIYAQGVKYTDTFVHSQYSAQHELGFHKFLEDFLYLELPMVPASDNVQRKLYLQLIFSSMFIEQKHGWSDLFSGMPILGIKESKKRVIEYILKLDTLGNEKKREQLTSDKKSIEEDWKQCYSALLLKIRNCYGNIANFPEKPCILKDEAIEGICILVDGSTISDRIKELEENLESLQRIKPKVVENFDELEEELKITEEEAHDISVYIADCKRELYSVQHRIQTVSKDMETIKIDLSNNKDAAKLQKLGSKLKLGISDNICPVCHQHIQDSLLSAINESPIMSVDENIKHLEAQVSMMQFWLEGHKKRENELKDAIEQARAKYNTVLRLAKAIRSDLYSVNDDLTESVVYKRIQVEEEIKKLSAAQEDLQVAKDCLRDLVKRWRSYLNEIERLPDKGLSKDDIKKKNSLRTKYIENLKRYGYKSIPDLDLITISDESYLPLYEGFDMKFDSSASDGIRVIWAFTMALLQVSLEFGGNHPGVLIFDEPDQQSTMISDMKEFLSNIVEYSDKAQIIIGITLKDGDTKEVISTMDEKQKKLIFVPNKAFQML